MKRHDSIPLFSVALLALTALPAQVENIGGALGGASGEPLLSIESSFRPDGSLDITLLEARADAAVSLVVGFSVADVPFAGGVVRPSPDIVESFFTGSDGRMELTIPNSMIPVGLSVFFQFVVDDPSVPGGIAFSNAVGIVTYDPIVEVLVGDEWIPLDTPGSVTGSLTLDVGQEEGSFLVVEDVLRVNLRGMNVLELAEHVGNLEQFTLTWGADGRMDFVGLPLLGLTFDMFFLPRQPPVMCGDERSGEKCWKVEVTDDVLGDEFTWTSGGKNYSVTKVRLPKKVIRALERAAAGGVKVKIGTNTTSKIIKLQINVK